MLYYRSNSSHYIKFRGIITKKFHSSVWSRTTRITDGKLPNHGKKWEDRCSHFCWNWWNHLVSFLNERCTIQLSIHVKFEIWPLEFGLKTGFFRGEVGDLLIPKSFLLGYVIRSQVHWISYVTIRTRSMMMENNILVHLEQKPESSRPQRPKTWPFLSIFQPQNM